MLAAIVVRQYLHHAGMIELLPDFAFALKAIVEHRIGLHFRMWDFDRDLAAIAQIGGAKDRGHAAAGDQAFNAVMVELVAGMKCHALGAKARESPAGKLAQLIRPSSIHPHAFHASNSD